MHQRTLVSGAVPWRDGQIQDLLGSTRDGSLASAIHNLGQVVGQGNSPAFPETARAFSYEADAVPDLNDLIPMGSECIPQFARGINNNGQIVGTGRPGIEGRLFTLTPTPELATLGLLAILLLTCPRRRSRP